VRSPSPQPWRGGKWVLTRPVWPESLARLCCAFNLIWCRASAGDRAAERRHIIAWLVRARTHGAGALCALSFPSKPRQRRHRWFRGPHPNAMHAAPIRGLKCANACAPSDPWGSHPRLHHGAPIRGLRRRAAVPKTGIKARPSQAQSFHRATPALSRGEREPVARKENAASVLSIRKHQTAPEIRSCLSFGPLSIIGC
jgi:hypothetical protein